MSISGGSMKLRYYTPEDYINGVPCVYRYRDNIETVTPIEMSGAHLFDGGRSLTFKFNSGYIRSSNIGGSDLTQVLYAAE